MSTGDETGPTNPPEASLGLTEAATLADAEISRFEALTASLRKIDVNSEKSLLRAARAFNDAVEAQARIASALPKLAGAFAAAQRREHDAAVLLVESGRRIEARTATFTALMQNLGAVGQEAAGVTELLRDFASLPPGGASNGHGSQAETIATVTERLDATVARARELHEQAVEADLTDVARQADSLHQQLAAAKKKLDQVRATLPK